MARKKSARKHPPRPSRHEPDPGLLDRAVALHQVGNLKQAAVQYRRYLRTDPDNTEVMHQLAGICYQLEDLPQAITLLQRALELAPEHTEYLNDLGGLYMGMGQHTQAEACLRRVLERSPDDPQVLYNLGMALYEQNRPVEAIECFETAIRLQPDYTEAHYNLGVALQNLGQIRRAEIEYNKAIALLPYLAQPHLKLGELYEQQRRRERAEASYRKALELNPGDEKTLIKLAEALYLVGKTAEAIEILRAHLQGHPHAVPVLLELAHLLHDAGDIEEAETIYRRVMGMHIESSRACYGLAGIRRFAARDDGIIREMETLLADKRATDTDRYNIHFALGKIHDDCGNYDQAFSHYRKGNAIQHQTLNYSRTRHEAYITAIMGVFNKDFFERHADLGCRQALPVFIVGMPRSGTTLTEQIIASHPEVAGAGELSYFSSLGAQLAYCLDTEAPFPRCMEALTPGVISEAGQHYVELLRRHSAEARLVTDKMPGNYVYLGLIRLLFPDAPIIHCQRDPMDVCLSIYFQSFQKGLEFAFDLEDIGHQYLQYRRLMAHWRKVLPVGFKDSSYEALVADQEAHSRELIAYCGLDWDDACLDFHAHKRDIRTASNWQVRQPIYRTSSRRWKNYERHLEPLRKMLEALPSD